MQLASHGATRTAVRNSSTLNMLRPPGAARAFHTPSILRAKPSTFSHFAARRVLTEARTFLGKFIAQLTTPGVGTIPSATRSFYGGPVTRIPSIESRLTPPARTILSRSSQQVRHFPRVPSAPRPFSATNMGLGTARNFSTGRTVFQSFADNVPVALRAFNEVDLDVKASKENFKRSLKADKRKQPHQSKSKQRPIRPQTQLLETVTEEKPSLPAAEMEKYFSSSTPNVTSQLLIPLAPTDYSSPPADPGGYDERLLPLRNLATIHNSHELHSLRVSSLFARLDAANVWERGVLCSAYAHSTSIHGSSTVLKVEFIGWTKEEVRSVIGESGTGWCVLEEKRTASQEEDHDYFSDTSSVLSDFSSEDALSSSGYNSPTQSLILPTLDFSSSFISSSSSSSLSSLNNSTTDLPLATPSSDTDSWVEDIDPWLGFSSDFVSRSGQQHV